MRGGAIPLAAWALLLAVLLVVNVLWTSDAIQAGEFGFAVAVTLAAAAVLAIASRARALRRGAPDAHPDRVEAAPAISFGAALTGIGLGALLFGLAFGHFLVYFGAGLILAGALRVAQEIASQRAEMRAYEGGEENAPVEGRSER